MTQNAYIHIPFCKSKCKYCSFISFSELDLKEKYLAALSDEIKYRYKGELLNTIYIGGGTPSLLTEREAAGIVNAFQTNKETEITIELNPENISESYLKNLKGIGVNRLSFGCQTFDDEILKYIGRRHNSNDVIKSVQLAKNAGFENISLDFIYGLPNQTIEMFEKDLKKAISLNIPHISLYGLKIDSDCFFAKNPPKNLPDEDIQADMYIKAIKILSENNYEHYEISNFSKKGFNSKHNLNYWKNNSYYGFGAAAHGYENGVRYSNYRTIDEYIKNTTKCEYSHRLSEQERLEEEIFLGFRKSDGINTEKINNKYNINFDKKYKNVLDKYLSLNYIEKTENSYKLTLNGILVSNVILADFIE